MHLGNDNVSFLVSMSDYTKVLAIELVASVSTEITARGTVVRY